MVAKTLQQQSQADLSSADLEFAHSLLEKAKPFIASVSALLDPLSKRVLETKQAEASKKLDVAMEAFLKMERQAYDAEVVEAVEHAWTEHEVFVTDANNFWVEHDLREAIQECVLEAFRVLIDHLDPAFNIEVAGLMHLVESMQVEAVIVTLRGQRCVICLFTLDLKLTVYIF